MFGFGCRLPTCGFLVGVGILWLINVIVVHMFYLLFELASFRFVWICRLML